MPLGFGAALDVVQRDEKRHRLADAEPEVGQRQRQFQLRVGWSGSPNLALPAYDSSLEVPDLQPA